ncbi:MAG TPA: hypothetical protein VL992_12785, partial [Tepidisphaeraceae bacterium]|nr:hypothetical protein [Tepidisphaeraceae bacterium]
MSISIIVQNNLDNDGGTVTPTNEGTYYSANTLRDAISFANSQSNTSTITFAGTLAGDTIALNSAYTGL